MMDPFAFVLLILIIIAILFYFYVIRSDKRRFMKTFFNFFIIGAVAYAIAFDGIIDKVFIIIFAILIVAIRGFMEMVNT